MSVVYPTPVPADDPHAPLNFASRWSALELVGVLLQTGPNLCHLIPVQDAQSGSGPETGVAPLLDEVQHNPGECMLIAV
eukprot:6459689-Amphidinium_carterae.2